LKKVVKTDAEWKKVQTINITFCVKGTERPYQMNLMTTIKRKLFCAACKLPLFSSKTKFNSGTGWPVLCDSNDQKKSEIVCAADAIGDIYLTMVLILTGLRLHEFGSCYFRNQNK
jgi:peptide methionine sulfoxide reductase MsrB